MAKISREFKFCAQSNLWAGCCDCCAHEVTVEAPVGTVVGYVKQKYLLFFCTII